MSDWIEEAALRFEGLSDDTIAKLQARQDDAVHILATMKLIWPRIARLAPVLDQAFKEFIQNQERLQKQ